MLVLSSQFLNHSKYFHRPLFQFERIPRWRAGWLADFGGEPPAIVENLAAVLAAEPKLFKSRRLLNECRTFVRYPDGNSGAAGGTHDDCVMAMAIALAARRAVVGELSPGRRLEMASLPVRG